MKAAFLRFGRPTDRTGLALRTGVILYAALLVAIPLSAVVARGFGDGVGSLLRLFSSAVARDALVLTLWSAAVVAVVNSVLGTAAAWVLVRYRFPGRGFLSSIIDLPLAIPTLVAGVMFVVLLGPRSPLGAWFAGHGIDSIYSPLAIVLALGFVTLPFGVRSVEPVLRELDPAEEEAAHTLGASSAATFFRVVLPPILPAIGTGALQCFARALAEFGSVVVVSGNIPRRTLTAPVFIFGEVESGDTGLAAAMAVVLLVLALALTLGARRLEKLSGLYNA